MYLYFVRFSRQTEVILLNTLQLGVPEVTRSETEHEKRNGSDRRVVPVVYVTIWKVCRTCFTICVPQFCVVYRMTLDLVMRWAAWFPLP
jgi:hypothetical protein